MGDKSGIEWTEATWNPVVGCSKVSPGCANCYAEAVHKTRLSGKGVYPPFRPWTPENAEHNVTLVPERLDQPLRWRKPRMIFVNSMSDLFHELVPVEFIAEVFSVMADAPRHTFQVLTKRPERMAMILNSMVFWAAVEWKRFDRRGGTGRVEISLDPLPNVWLGTSIENRAWLSRVRPLRKTPAAVRWISAEPLLGPLVPEGYSEHTGPVLGRYWRDGRAGPGLDLDGIDWLVVGGESGGPRHRELTPLKGEWVRDLRDAALATHVGRNGGGCAFFFKQWGGRTAKAGGRLLDGRTWDEYPRQLTLSRKEA